MKYYKRSTAPYSVERKDSFKFSPSDKQVMFKLNSIITKGDGLYVFSGMRGTGKTSILNKELYEWSNYENLIIHLPFYTDEIDLKISILAELGKAIKIWKSCISKKFLNEQFSESCNENRNKGAKLDKSKICQFIHNLKEEDRKYRANQEIYKKFENKLKFLNVDCNFNVMEKINRFQKKLKFKIQNNSYINSNEVNEFLNFVEKYQVNISKYNDLEKEINELIERYKGERITECVFEENNYSATKYGRNKTFGVSLNARIPFLKMLEMLEAHVSIKAEENHEITEENIECFKEIISEVDTLQKKENEWENLIRRVTKSHRLVIIIDEIDKISYNDTEKLLLENKRLFFDIKNTATILITDLSHGIFLKNNLNEYISDFIFQKVLAFDDWLIMSQNLGISNHQSLRGALENYSESMGNYRKIINSEIISATKKLKTNHSISLFFIQRHEFLRSVDIEYYDLLVKFFIEIVELLYQVGNLSNIEIAAYLKEFLQKNKLEDIKTKIIFDKFVRKIEERFTINWMELPIGENLISYEKAEELAHHFNKIQYNIYDSKKKCFTKELLCAIEHGKYEFLSESAIGKDFLDYYLTSCSFSLNLDNLEMFGISKNKIIRLRKEINGDSVERAKNRISEKINEYVGIVIFYPYWIEGGIHHNDDPLLNGYIVFQNEFSEYTIEPFVGYPGLTTHKPHRLEEFIQYLMKEKIPFVEIENDDLPEDFWKTTSNNSLNNIQAKEHIYNVMKKNQNKWINALLQRNSPSMGINPDTIVGEIFKERILN